MCVGWRGKTREEGRPNESKELCWKLALLARWHVSTITSKQVQLGRGGDGAGGDHRGLRTGNEQVGAWRVGTGGDLSR